MPNGDYALQSCNDLFVVVASGRFEAFLQLRFAGSNKMARAAVALNLVAHSFQMFVGSKYKHLGAFVSIVVTRFASLDSRDLLHLCVGAKHRCYSNSLEMVAVELFAHL